MTFARRKLLVGALGAALGALTGCVDNRRESFEEWLRSRPWVATVERVQALGGPVPLPGPAALSARVDCVPGTDRAALNGIRAELEEYATANARHVQSLLVHLDHDVGLQAVSGTPATNDGLFRLLDLALGDPRAERIEIESDTGVTLRVQVAAVLAYAEKLTSADPGDMRATILVRDAGDTASITTAFGHAAGVRGLAEVVEAGRQRAEVAGFAGNTVTEPPRLTVTLAHRDPLARTFRDLRAQWPEADLDLTVAGDRLGLRGPESVIDRLPAATQVMAAGEFSWLLVHDTTDRTGRGTLSGTVDDATRIAAAGRAIGDHPEATGDGSATLGLEPGVRLHGTTAEIAAQSGPTQAVMTGGGASTRATSVAGVLTLWPDSDPSGFQERCRAMRAAGWPGTLSLQVQASPFTVAYESTDRGRARNVEVIRDLGREDTGATAWISAWDATAGE